MLLETPIFDAAPRAPFAANAASPHAAALPAELVLTQRAAKLLRAYLESRGLRHYRIFSSRHFDLDDLDPHLPQLAAEARWEQAPPLVERGEPIALLVTTGASACRGRLLEAGFCRIEAFGLVLARWHWEAPGTNRPTRSLWLYAAPDAQPVLRLREALARLSRGRNEAHWQIVSGDPYDDEPRVARVASAGQELLLQPELQQRIEADVLSFFRPEVTALYEKLNVPYRRGVLIYGPPGNGKTSIIRWIGGALMHVPAMILRANGPMETDALAEVIRRWKRQAPAILVIEDLDWLLAAVNVSTFLNLIDGIEASVTGGLMLIATTNHPHKLDSAINNRPGRFDVSIEVASPQRGLRREFFRRSLLQVADELIDQLADATDFCSFAHLHEVLRLSGLFALHAGRAERSQEDLRRAAGEVVASQQAAASGFPAKPELPFGLQHLHQMKKSH